MKIIKVLNNNVALVHDELGFEQVVMGRGLAFQKRPGDRIDPQVVDKIFALQCGELLNRLSELLAEIPLDVVTASASIINMAAEALSVSLHESLAISLTDHIHFAICRHQKNLRIPNSMQWEMCFLYPREYELGLRGLAIIDQRLGVQLPEEEAGLIALHLVNAQLHGDMPEVLDMTQFMQQILNQVKTHLNIEYQTASLSYNRFVTHLRFFAQRMLGKKGVFSEDDSLQQVVMGRYPEAYRCVEEIEQLVLNTFDYRLGGEEGMFLTIHIERVRKETLSLEVQDDEV